MLTRYKDDTRIALIAGDSYVPFSLRHPSGYYFSKYTQGGGWATWRRFWTTYDYKLDFLPYEGWKNLLCKYTAEGIERTYWIHRLDDIRLYGCIAYEMALQFCVWYNRQLVIYSGNNLITNTGFNRDDATHASWDSHIGFRRTAPLPGPFPDQNVEADNELDQRKFLWHYFWKEADLINFVRHHDAEYERLVKKYQKDYVKNQEEIQAVVDSNKNLIELNKRLTAISEQHDAYICQLHLQLEESASAYKERIHYLEKQHVNTNLHAKFLQKLRAFLKRNCKKNKRDNGV